MRIYLDQIGCRLNYSEMDTLAANLRDAGHAVVGRADQAQVIVFNSCAVTAAAGRKSRQRIRQLAKAHPQARIALTGCWATLRPRLAAELPGVSLVVDNTRKDLIHTLLESWSADFDDPDALTYVEPDGNPFQRLASGTTAGDPGRTRRTRAFVKVQDGCNNRCTFCIVTFVRGESRSRSVESIVDEIRTLSEEGVQEVVLTGVHLGGYGRDLTGGDRVLLKTLVHAVLLDTNIARLRLSSLEPWELADGFFDLWAQWPHRLCPHLHLPLQAGTDAQLRRMARRCTTAGFRQLVCDARESIADLIITTDIIVGFPGESDSHFQAGLDFVNEMRFAHAHVFPFSARAGTAAARYGAQVKSTVKKQRSRRMHATVARTGRQERGRFLHKVRPVLWEADSRELDDGAGRLWTGFTDNYLRVTVEVPNHIDLHNRITPVRLTELHGETFHGRIYDENLPMLSKSEESFDELRVRSWVT